MSYPLNNVTTQDGYTPATTLEGLPPCHKLNVIVSNAAIYLQIKQRFSGNENWQPEVFMTPSFVNLSRVEPITGYRVRSGSPGTPAQVTLDAVP